MLKSQAHKNALHMHLRAGGNLHSQAKPPANPMKVIAASRGDDELLKPATEATDTKPDLTALMNALTAGRLSPADAQKVCACFSLGIQPDAALLDRVKAALTDGTK